MEELVCMRSVSGDACRSRESAGSNPRLCLKKKDFFKEFITSLTAVKKRQLRKMASVRDGMVTAHVPCTRGP